MHATRLRAPATQPTEAMLFLSLVAGDGRFEGEYAYQA